MAFDETAFCNNIEARIDQISAELGDLADCHLGMNISIDGETYNAADYRKALLEEQAMLLEQWGKFCQPAGGATVIIGQV